MGVPIRWLVARRELRLTVLAGRDGLDREVDWAHSIELSDPTPWLSGGELLLTTGLRLTGSGADCRRYVRRLADIGVAALGFGTGLSHEQVPPALVEAAEEAGLPLLEVPLPTPFVAITKAVMARLAELQYESVVQASRVQPRMTRAALHGGAQAVVRELAVSTRTSVLLLDDTGAVRAAHPSAAAGPEPGILAELRSAEQAATTVSSGPHGAVVTHQVRVGPRSHGRLVLVSDREPTPVDHLLLGHAASLLALEAEKPLRLRDEQNRVNSLFLRMVLDGTVPEPAARDHLTEAGFPVHEGIRVLVLRGGSPQRALDAAGQDLAGRGLPRFAAEREGCAALLLPGAGTDTAGAVVAGTAAGLRPRPWAGLSDRHELTAGPAALREAMNAAAAGQARGRPDLVTFESLAGRVLVSTPETRAVLEVLSDTRLRPLAAYDRENGTELLDSLRAFLEHHGQWESASSALGVHRHTLRNRMERIHALLGVDLDSAHVRAELLLALAAWQGAA
ncbi:PucR family transcriptional regulator [Streptomyces sp. SYSU K217416]